MKTASYTRHHVNITMCKAKANGNYINSMLALREALDAGAEEALLLDNEGYVAEGSGEDIFLVRDGVLHTQAHFLLKRHYPQYDLRPGSRSGLGNSGTSHHPGRGLHL